MFAFTARTATVLASVLLISAPAAAQGTDEERSACTGDAFRFCAGDIPNVSKIEACLDSKKGELTPACRAEFKPTQAKKTKLKTEHFR